MNTDNLVIHAGELLPKDQALALMMGEFSPYGYSAIDIEMLLNRAFDATQYFLYELSFRSPADRKTHLDLALVKDAECAARWRAQPPGQREAHAKRLQDDRQRREEAEKAQVAAAKYYREQYEEERKQREKAHVERQQKAREEERKASLERQFQAWEQHNRAIDRYNEAAPLRAAERKRIDDKAARRVIARIECWQSRHRRRAAIDLVSEIDLPLNDHDYIEWRFRCASHPSRRWLAHCPIVRPAL